MMMMKTKTKMKTKRKRKTKDKMQATMVQQVTMALMELTVQQATMVQMEPMVQQATTVQMVLQDMTVKPINEIIIRVKVNVSSCELIRRIFLHNDNHSLLIICLKIRNLNIFT